MKKAKKKDGVIRPFLWLRTKVDGGVGSPTREICLQTAPPMVVCKCALRFSKGIEPRRAHVSFGATPKVQNALLLEKSNKN